MTKRVINVIKRGPERGDDTTDIALLVSTSSKSEINIWDKSKITDSLIKETGASGELAQDIADAVERKIFESNFGTITTSIIRELIDIELIERGLSMIHKKHSHIGLPIYDVEQIILSANKENSNTTHNPESINLTIAETILKEYALRKIFSEDVALAHLMGDIHLHDLGFIVRPYSFMGDSVVYCRQCGSDSISTISMEQLYDSLPFETTAEEGVWIKFPRDVEVLDRNNKWVKVIRVVRKSRENKRMLFIRTSDGKTCVITDDHPVITTAGTKPAREVKKGDRLTTVDLPSVTESIKHLNLVTELSRNGAMSRYAVLLNGEKIPFEKVHSYIVQGQAKAEDYSKAYVRTIKGSDVALPVSLPLTEDLGWLIGFHIAEGHTEDNSLGFTCAPGEEQDKLINILEGLDISFEQKAPNRICVNSTPIRDLFREVFKIGSSARTKSLPANFINYPSSFLRGIIGGILDGDGTIDKNSACIRVASSKLVNQVNIALERVGLSPSCRKPEGAGSVRYWQGRTITQNYPIFGVAFGRKREVEIPSFKYQKLPCQTRESTLDPAGEVQVTHVVEVDIPDEYIYDITTESGTLICNGIYSHNCGGHSLEYIKKYGLALPNITSTSRPAKHAEVLIGHMVKMASSLQAHYAGAIGWEAVNMFFAPHLVGRPYEEIKQLAQMLIYEFNQLAGARGSQVVFTDFNLYWNIPKHFRDTPAIGPGGEYTGKTYKEYEKEAQAFLRAMFEIYLEGDAMGKTFVFPKPLLHINEDFFNTPGWEEFMDLACEVASKQGITYFVFDRGDETTVSQCCRLKLRLGERDLGETKTPEKMRFSALQNITINLPRMAYKAQGNDELLFAELNRALELVAKAHLQKKKFIASLMELGKDGPLALLSASKDGEPYLRLDRLTYLAGILGLNEMIQAHTGQQLHESDEALKFGLKVISHMNIKCKQLSDLYGIKLVLEESPAESSGYRLAKLDTKYFPEQTKKVIKGNVETGEYYYTNSIHLTVNAPIDYIERVQKQSLFHPLIEAGAICHIWLGEHEPSPQSIKNFTIKTFKNTRCAQVAFSPEFTVCNECQRTSRGLAEACPLCGSEDAYGVTRIVGYFSKVPTWNKGKIGELKDRMRTDLEGRNGESETVRAGKLSQMSRGQSACVSG